MSLTMQTLSKKHDALLDLEVIVVAHWNEFRDNDERRSAIRLVVQDIKQRISEVRTQMSSL